MQQLNLTDDLKKKKQKRSSISIKYIEYSGSIIPAAETLHTYQYGFRYSRSTGSNLSLNAEKFEFR